MPGWLEKTNVVGFCEAQSSDVHLTLDSGVVTEDSSIVTEDNSGIVTDEAGVCLCVWQQKKSGFERTA